MQKEILFATYFLNYFIKFFMRRGELEGLKRLKLKSELGRLLRKHYIGHWFPQDPKKESDYRRLTFDGGLDPIFYQALRNVNLCTEWMHWKFLDGLSLYIDPLSIDVQIKPEEQLFKLYTMEKTNVDNINNANVKLIDAVISFKTWRERRGRKIKREYNL